MGKDCTAIFSKYLAALHNSLGNPERTFLELYNINLLKYLTFLMV